MSSIRDMVQMLVSLKELQLRQSAQDLATQQFGLQQQQNVTQTAASQTGMLGSFQQLLQGMSNPAAMLPYVSEMAKRTGFSPDAMQTMIQGTPASVAATQGAATQAANAPGPNGEPGLLNAQTAARLAQEYDQSKLLRGIFGTAQQALNSMHPEQAHAFGQGVLQKEATGQSVEDAVMSQRFAELTPDVQKQAVLVGKRLIPGASEDAQARLGVAHLNLAQRQQDLEAAKASLEYKAQIAALEGKGGVTDKHTLELLKDRNNIMNEMQKGSSTANELGTEAFRSQFNAINDELRRLHPDIYGKGASQELRDLPKGSTTTSSPFMQMFQSSPLQSLNNSVQQQRQP